MSGAALFAGPFLVGVVVVDAARFGADRMMAAPVAPLLADAELAGLFGVGAVGVLEVGPQFRLAVTAETSIALAPPYRAPTGRLGRAPTRLLLPVYGVVPFVGRDCDLDIVGEWCLTGAASALRVIVGAGGSGKTRLAAEACVRMTGQGWQAGFAHPKAPGGQAQLEFDQPTLVVVDDADLNVPLLADLVRTVAYWPPGAPAIRLLLLARHTTGWWETLNWQTDHLAAELADTPLTLHDGDLLPAERTDHYSRALTAFAAHVAEAVAPGGQMPPVLDEPAFANPLLIHMHALLSVCGSHVPTTGTAVRERILDAVLDRERERWAATFPPGFPIGGARTRQQAVTAATLLAPPTEAAAAQVMMVIGELRPDAAAGARAAAATWLRELYPGSDPPWVAPLLPDLLTEQLLASCPQLNDLILAGYSNIGVPAQVEQLLTQLIRADTRTTVHQALNQLLAAHLPGLLTTAIDNPATPLPDILAVALTRCPQPEMAVSLVVGQFPGHSIGLAALAATVGSQAIAFYRQLAQAEPDVYLPDLAQALGGQSHWLSRLGRLEEALEVNQEAVAICQHLAQPERNAIVFPPLLVPALMNLASTLGQLGRAEEAVPMIDVAVTINRQLVQATPGEAVPAGALATSLGTQSSVLSDLGRREEALAAVDEAVAIRRALAQAQDDGALPGLALSLNNQARCLQRLGRPEEGLAATEEALSIHQQLAQAQPDVFLSDLAMSLTNRGVLLMELGREDEALAAGAEAITIYQQLAQARPDAFVAELAGSLLNHSAQLSGLGRLEEALAATEEAITILRELAQTRPSATVPKLALALRNQFLYLSDLGRDEEATAAIEEAVTLFRALAETRPDSFLPDLAQALRNLSDHFSKSGRRAETLAVIDETVAIYRQAISSRHPEVSPVAAFKLGQLLAERGDIDGARTAYQQAIHSRHPEQGPKAAVQLGLLIAKHGDVDGARAAYELAIDSSHPDQAPWAAVGLGLLLAAQGDTEDARAAYQQAIDSRHIDAAPTAALGLGQLLAEKGDTEGARAAYQQAIDSRHPRIAPIAAAQLGNLLAVQGDGQEGTDGGSAE
jgi:tetratricopeptide (TPR) repeat protein